MSDSITLLDSPGASRVALDRPAERVRCFRSREWIKPEEYALVLEHDGDVFWVSISEVDDFASDIAQFDYDNAELFDRVCSSQVGEVQVHISNALCSGECAVCGEPAHSDAEFAVRFLKIRSTGRLEGLWLHFECVDELVAAFNRVWDYGEAFLHQRV